MNSLQLKRNPIITLQLLLLIGKKLTDNEISPEELNLGK